MKIVALVILIVILFPNHWLEMILGALVGGFLAFLLFGRD